MILVTLGTQKQKFYRLLDMIDKYDFKDEIIVQAGGSKDYKSDKMKIFEFISYEEMDKLLDKADLVITHGGTGSIISALNKGKKVIACARLSKYGEHVDDHQNELVDNFADAGYLLKIGENDKFEDIVSKSIKFKPKKYKSNKEEFIKKLVDKIG